MSCRCHCLSSSPRDKIGVSKVMGHQDGRCPEGSGGDEMIFDTLTALITALLFFSGMWFSYILGKADKKEKKSRECDGWRGIVNYDHSEGGVGREHK